MSRPAPEHNKDYLKKGAAVTRSNTRIAETFGPGSHGFSYRKVGDEQIDSGLVGVVKEVSKTRLKGFRHRVVKLERPIFGFSTYYDFELTVVAPSQEA